MSRNEIGINAGIVWNYIDSKNKCSIKELKTKLNIKEEEINMAIGWLACENKIGFFKDKKEHWLFLIY